MGRATRILIVDDDDDFRAALRQVVEDEGCTVNEAADGKMATKFSFVSPTCRFRT
jgi:CheY-like chemotaxis protein